MSVQRARARKPLISHKNTLGRYELVAPLGQGGMGTIHLAVAGGLADFRKLLVVKELRQDLSANQRFVEMFLDEAKLAARLNHPNVVQTIEAGQDGDRYFLSMEFLDGQPYSAIWQGAEQSPSVALPIRLKILCDALAGLHYAHTLTEYDGSSLRIVHRDVSPQNIFVTYDGQVKVVDFGIANATVSSAGSTLPGLFKGKFGYAAPEQVRGETVDARTDVFAMGVVLLETLTMQRFSDGVVSRSAVAARLAGREPRALQLNHRLDPQLTAICDRALAVDPDARFASADELRIALDEYLVHSGMRVEIATVKQVLATKFAVERRTMHQLIDRHSKYGPVEQTHVSAIVFGQEAGNNQPTEVADLAKFVRDTTEQTVVSGVATKLARESRWRSPRVIGLGAVVALGFGFGVLRLATSSEPTVVPAVIADAVPQPAAPALQPPAAAPAKNGASKPAVTAVAPAEPARPSPGDGPSADAPLMLQIAHPAARPAPRRVARIAAPSASAMPLAAEPAPPPAETPRLRSEPDAGNSSAKATFGSDLNSGDKAYQRRNIDTDL